MSLRWTLLVMPAALLPALGCAGQGSGAAPNNEQPDATVAVSKPQASPDFVQAREKIDALRMRYQRNVSLEELEERTPGNGLGAPSLGKASSEPVIKPGTATRFDRDDAGLHPIFAEKPSKNSTAWEGKVTLPIRADQPVSIADSRSDISLSFKLQRAFDAPVQVGAGLAVYDKGGPSLSTIIHRPDIEGTEDYVLFDSKPREEVLEYQVDLHNVKGLRLVSNVLEFQDEIGTPRLRIAKPWLTDATGEQHAAKLTVEGCRYDTKPSMPWGRPLVEPGSDHCTVKISWSDVRYPIVVDPSWHTTGSMSTIRSQHNAWLMAADDVLVAAGNSLPGLQSSELYRRGYGAWVAAADMQTQRAQATGDLASDGDPLIVGGSTSAAYFEKFDPGSGSWYSPGALVTARYRHTMTKLADGRFLIAGGSSASYLSSAELIAADAQSNAALTGPMSTGRYQHAAARVASSGEVVVTGGKTPGGNAASVEYWRASTGVWTTTNPMTTARYGHNLFSPSAGSARLVAAGGFQLNTVEHMTTVGGSWSSLPSMPAPRYTSVFLQGLNLQVGGNDGSSYIPIVEQFSPTLSNWTTHSTMNEPRGYVTATVLSDGTSILVAGGTGPSGRLSTAELYGTFPNGVPCTDATSCASGYCVDGVCCNGACTGTCVACTNALKYSGSDGVCGTIKLGYDPQNECPLQPPCGFNGVCSGTGTCQFIPPGTVCNHVCAGGQSTEYKCNGAGACNPGTAVQCTPYTCGSGGVCLTSCSGDADCIDDQYYCAGNTCVVKKAVGTACLAANECLNDNCVDGFCCNSGCAGLCMACAKSYTGNSDGTCSPVVPYTDPQAECADEGVNTCGQNGYCSGNGTCAMYPDGTTCATSTCSGNILITPECTGGSCMATSKNCEPFACTSGACRTSCTSGSDCAADYYCAGGNCVATKALGLPCALGEECQSGVCADGVCCDQPCTSMTCMACTKALRGGAQGDGYCLPVTAGTDPKANCTDLGAPSCRDNGWCDGNGSCQSYPDGTTCASPTCSGTQWIESTCLNLGCSQQVTQCAPYVCNATSGCLTSCGNDLDCISTHYCSNNTCVSKGTSGQACTSPSQCTPANCVDGFCCDSPCTGLCMACSGAKKGDNVDGICGPIAFDTDPDNECAQAAQNTCGNYGTCGSGGVCRLWPVNTTCGTAACGASGYNTFLCDGVGVCKTSTQDCKPFACTSTGCKSTCTVNADCATGYYCAGSSGCLILQALGTACTGTAQCASGFCADGVCCESACGGGAVDCQSCSAVQAGFCKFLPSTTVCRAIAGPCDQAENCTGSTATCPADTFLGASTVCRGASNECDNAEVCPGNSASCPADTVKSSSTSCTDDGKICTVDKCNGVVGGAACTHVAGNSGVVCNAAVNECDLAETCTGGSTECPANVVKSSGTGCTDDGNVCTTDLCNGVAGNPLCNHAAGNAGATCRGSVGLCDAAETCNGASVDCPTDLKQSSGYKCRDANGDCDVADYCDGASNTCGADNFRPSSYQCRAASCTGSTATLPANCTGSSSTCPTAQTQSCSPSTCSGDVCGGCTDDTQCTSTQWCSSGVCVAKKANGQTCSGTNQCTSGFCVDGVCCNTACNAGICDSCANSGFVGSCTAVPGTTVCRPAADECDVAETCSGQTTCPTDAKKPANTPCADEGLPCTKDICDGNSVVCTHPAGNLNVQCRAANGSACDVADVCDGASTTCPDSKRPNTYSCRDSAGDCDVAEYCTGTTDACPADAKKTVGTACPDDGLPCTADTCNGTSAQCQHPAGNAGVVCRDSNGPCDLEDKCNGTTTNCFDAKEPTSKNCRPSVGDCDVDDFCNGGDQCPTDEKKSAGTACPDDGSPCSLDICDGTANTCKHPAGNQGLPCRSSQGPCDATDTCNGISTNCNDLKQLTGTPCRPVAGDCDIAESCDGTNNTCPADNFKTASVQCRPASCTAAIATLAANCSGSAADCPAVQTQDCAPSSCAGTTCGGCTVDNECPTGKYCSAGICTNKKVNGVGCGGPNQCSTGFCVDGVCCDTVCAGGTCDSCALSGSVGTCTAVVGTTVCRPAASECDVAETCNGNKTCPADTNLNGQACSTDNNICTTDVCQGTTCAHIAAPSNTVCRQAVGECDVDETCGGATTCPADVFKADNTTCTTDGNVCTVDVCKGGQCTHDPGNANTVCRTAAGECDAQELCTGTSAACPNDVMKADDTSCTADGNVCTRDVCISGSCSHPAGNSGTVCRPAATECDLDEQCDGASPNCPNDVLKNDGVACTADALPCTLDQCASGVCVHPAGHANEVCRAASGECDLPETCDGANPSCPNDLFKAENTACTDDGIFCTKDECLSGVCSHPSNDGAACSDSNVCTSDDKCAVSQCVGTPIQGCNCQGNQDCDDSNACNGQETCASGSCIPGTNLNCNDNNPCTTDGCDNTTGCTHVNLTDGSACNDGLFCKINEKCQGGQCVAPDQLDCSAAATGVCQVGVCDETKLGCVSQPKADNTVCDDNDPCTGNDKCTAGVCSGGLVSGCKACQTPADCNDNNECTTDNCNDATKTCDWTAIQNCTPDAGPDAPDAAQEAGPDAETEAGQDAKVDAQDAKPDTVDAKTDVQGDVVAEAQPEGATPDAPTSDQAAGGSAGSAPAEPVFTREAPGCACRTADGGSKGAPLGLAAGALLIALALRRRTRRSDEERTML